MAPKNPRIAVALIGAAALIVAAAIPTVLQRWSTAGKPQKGSILGGIVVDQATNQAVPQATISITGRTDTYVTEDNGNFRIYLRTVPPERLRLHVTKSGFQPLDITVEPPAENLVLQLRKQ